MFPKQRSLNFQMSVWASVVLLNECIYLYTGELSVVFNAYDSG